MLINLACIFTVWRSLDELWLYCCGLLTEPGRLSLELGAVWYGAKGGHSIFARVPGDTLLLSPGGQRGPEICTRAMRVAVHSLWSAVYLPLALYVHCGWW